MPIEDDEPKGLTPSERSAWAVGRAIHRGVRAGGYRAAAKQFPDGADTLLAAAQINSRRASELLKTTLDEPPAEGGIDA